MSLHSLYITFNPRGTLGRWSVVEADANGRPTGKPRPATAEEVTTFGPLIDQAALDRIDELEAEKAALVEAHAAEIASLQAAAAAATASTVLGDLDAAFEHLVPEAVQPAFEPAWATVRNLIQAGKVARAVAFVRALTVPPELADTRDQIADLIAAAGT